MHNNAPVADPLWPRRLSAALGVYAFLGGAISFSGWALDIPRLTDWVSNDVSIQPNAAVLIALGGAVVLVLRLGARRVATALGGLVALLGGLTLMQYAYDGEAAVEAAAKQRPDVILLDIGLPKLNGYDACRRIRENRWADNVAIIALTGWGQEEDRRKSAEAGFDGHLVKPVDHSELLKLLASLSPQVES